MKFNFDEDNCKTKAKWTKQGWEFVSENRGTVRTELNFRRVKPKTFGARVLSTSLPRQYRLHRQHPAQVKSPRNSAIKAPPRSGSGANSG